jgi:hypothetical protein
VFEKCSEKMAIGQLIGWKLAEIAGQEQQIAKNITEY